MMVWICVMVISMSGGGSSIESVGNIATQADCERLGKRFQDTAQRQAKRGSYSCTQVRVVR